jgi:thioredoxin-dependent peroxiredoxin
MLKPGDRAPDFELPDEEGRTVRLSSLLEGGPLVLYFYPSDFTPVCTREACMFRDMHEMLAARGIRVIGINTQPPDMHRKFRASYSLPFPLLSDPERLVVKAYRADGFLGLMVRRVSYFVDSDGTILDCVQADLQLARHREFVNRALARFQGGGGEEA